MGTEFSLLHFQCILLKTNNRLKEAVRHYKSRPILFLPERAVSEFSIAVKDVHFSVWLPFNSGDMPGVIIAVAVRGEKFVIIENYHFYSGRITAVIVMNE
jgi:hypothetical protein